MHRVLLLYPPLSPVPVVVIVVQLDAGDESETSRALRIDPWHLLSRLGVDSYHLLRALCTSIESYMSLFYPILRVSRKSTASLNLNHAFPNQPMVTDRIVTREMSIVKYRESQRSHNCVNRLSCHWIDTNVHARKRRWLVLVDEYDRRYRSSLLLCGADERQRRVLNAISSKTCSANPLWRCTITGECTPSANIVMSEMSSSHYYLRP
jgi:hypothetical protein